MSNSEPLLGASPLTSAICLDSSEAARAARQTRWTEYLRTVCHEDAIKWRNKCGSLLRRIRRVRETMDRSINGETPTLSPMETAIEDLSIETGLDYEESKSLIDLSPRGERGGTTQQTLWDSSEFAKHSSSNLSDPAFALDQQLATTLTYPLVWIFSRSLWLVVGTLFVSFLVQQSWLAGIPLVLIVVLGLPSFPYPPHALWGSLLGYQLTAILAKCLWQFAIVCDSGDVVGWKFFSLGQSHCPPVYVDTRAMRLGLFKCSSYLSLLWPDVVVVGAIFVHLRSLFLTGRSGLPPRKAREAIAGSTVNLGSTTRPTWDTYTARFLLAMTVTVLLITNWSRVSASKLPQIGPSSSILGESVSRNHFSAIQVLAITVFLFQVVADRAIYIVMSHSPTRLRKLVLFSVTVQFLLLLFAMNLRLVLPFFLPHSAYLVLTARQLAFDIRPTGTRSGFLWQKGYASHYAYRVYLAIPFLDELRQICDWAASPATALSLFMWFKVEDCIQNLRFVQAEMDSRQPLAKTDRTCMGVSAIVGLVAIITGPLVFFSGLNVLREQNPIVLVSPSGDTPSGLRIFLQVPGSLPRLQLYSSNQMVIQAVSSADSAMKDDEVLAPLLVLQSADLQRVSFPAASDSDWTLSAPLKDQLVTSLENFTDLNVTITAQWTLARQLSPWISTLTSTASIPAAALLEAIQTADTPRIAIPNLIPSVAYLDSTSSAKVINEKGSHADTFLQLDLDRKGHEWWNLMDSTGVLFLAERSIGTGATPGSTGSGYAFSVVGLYLGVVLTVGRLLRLSLQGSSKRIDVEELPSTETLMQLCQGIEVARLFKDTDTEQRLYYDLVKVFRDPQLLLAATGPTNRQ